MKNFKRILKPIILIALIIVTFINNNIRTSAQVTPEKLVKAAVVLNSFDDLYISLVQQNLEEIQKKNQDKIEFTFYDGKRDQTVQNQIINSVLNNNFDILLANLVDLSINTVDPIINKFKERNIPIVLFNVVPFVTNSIKSYNKALIISTNAEQSGILEGNILVDEWKNNRKSIDTNQDNILQYVMLRDKKNDTLTVGRTKYSVQSINAAGIKTQELALLVSDGSQESTRNALESFFIATGGKIEAIIANDDTIAIGAIKVLQKYGYNTGNESKRISVVGINGVPEAIDLIKQNIMEGTVLQDAPAMAEALYITGINLVHSRNPLEGTNYKFDESGVTIKLPYQQYIKQ